MNTLMLIARLRVIQEAENLTDKAFAKKLGIDTTYWGRLQKGSRHPGVTFLGSILFLYPGLRQDVLDYLLSRKSKD